MPPREPQRISLRRSCQACAKQKRHCDQRLPKCSRCATKGTTCEYINIPWAVKTTGHRVSSATRSVADASFLQSPLRIEMLKTFDGGIIRFLIDGMRTFPITFAQQMKTLFIHPEIYGSSGLVQEIYTLCKSYESHAPSPLLFRTLRRKSIDIHRQASRASSFEDLLIFVQALILIHCILAFDDYENEFYSETTSNMLTGLAWRLWEQAPIQLPHVLSPKRAWLFAESVRRTIIIAYMLCSTYSLGKRSFSVRTPFVEALPFDVRTTLWDEPGDGECEEGDISSPVAMVSLREYSDMLASGCVHGVPYFGSLILAVCKGMPASRVAFPPTHAYQEELVSSS